MTLTTKTLKRGLIGSTALVAAAMVMAPQVVRAVPLTGTNPGVFTMSAGSDLVITASATITASSTNNTTGVFNSVLGGSLVNRGLIDVDVVDTQTALTGYGILFSGGSVSGNFTNTGSIDVRVQATTTEVASDASAYAYGIDVNASGDISGAFTNSGTIDVYAGAFANGTGTASAYAYAAGYQHTGATFQIGGFTNTNTGSISVDAVADSISHTAQATAYGIDWRAATSGTVTGGFTNAGTISASATADTSDTQDARADAWGVYMQNMLLSATGTGTSGFNNTGTISASASANSNASDIARATADGLYFTGVTVSGNFNNSGTITSGADGSADGGSLYVYSDAIEIYNSTINGDFNNTNIITATNNVNAQDTYVDNYATIGYMTGNTFNGHFLNSGTISSNANTTHTGVTDEYGYNYAYGLYMTSNTVTGNFNNSGTISSSASHTNSADSYAYAYAYSALYFGNNMNIGGDFINSGTISTTATADANAVNGTGSTAYAYASYGFYAFNGGADSFDNSGTISVTATATSDDDDATAYAYYPLYLNGFDTTGDFTNSGTISATATASVLSGSSDAYAYANASGLTSLTIGTVAGSFLNSGTISATATATNNGTTGDATAYAYAYGFDVNNVTVNGNFENTGTISTEATAVSDIDSAYAYAESALYMSGTTINGDFSNSGTISNSASATGGTTGSATAYYALYMSGGGVTGDWTNSGTISNSATAVSLSSDGSAYGYTGIYMSGFTVGGDITNSGSVTTSAEATGHTYASATADYAWYMTSVNADSFTNTNAGVISATASATTSETGTADAEAYVSEGGALYLNNVDLTGAFTNDGTISGYASAYGADTEADVDAIATGLTINSDSDFGSFANNGTISAEASATNASDYYATASAYGFFFSGDAVSGLFSNDGTISASATANSPSFAYALATGLSISTNANLNGGFENDGTISATATATSTDTGDTYNVGSAYANAFVFDAGNVDGFVNNGSILATATASGQDPTVGPTPVYAEANGLWFSTSSPLISGDFENTGTISAVATATQGASSYASANAWGIDMNTTVTITGLFTNSGAISAVASASGTTVSASGYAYAYGVEIDSGSSITNALVNTGSITASATANSGSAATSGSAYAYGIDNEGALIGFSSTVTYGLINSGTISASVSGSNLGASQYSAVGIWNSGTISGGLINSGTISGGTGGLSGSGGTGAAIYYSAGAGDSPIFLNGGRVIGDILDDGFQGSATSSVTTVMADFTTEGDFQVSDFLVEGANTVLTISAGDSITMETMSNPVAGGTLNFAVDSTSVVNGYGSLVVDDAGDNDNIDLTGYTVTVDVGLGNFEAGDEFMIGDGESQVQGLTGAGQAATTVADNSFLWDFTLADGSQVEVTGSVNNEDLYLVAVQANSIANTATTTGNREVGTVLTTTEAQGGLQESDDPAIQAILTALNSASSAAEVNAILEAAQAEHSGGHVMAAFNTMMQVWGLTDQRLAAAWDDHGSMAAGNGPDGLRLWGQFFGSSSGQDRRDNVSGYDADTLGLAIGADFKVADRSIVGASFAYADTEVDSNSSNRGNTEVDSYQFSLYGSHYFNKDTFVNLMAAYSRHDNDTTRIPVAGVIANGEFDADQMSVRGVLGRDYLRNDVQITPYGSLYYSQYDPDNYTERGAGGANLTVEGDQMDVFEIGVGVDATWLHKSGDLNIEPTLSLGYAYDVVGDEIDYVSTFQAGGNAFRTEGFDPAQHRFNAGVGVRVYSNEQWDFTAEYDFNYKSDYDSHSGLLRAAYNF